VEILLYKHENVHRLWLLLLLQILLPLLVIQGSEVGFLGADEIQVQSDVEKLPVRRLNGVGVLERLDLQSLFVVRWESERKKTEEKGEGKERP